MQLAFGSGTIWGVRTDVANSTPVKFGVLQEGSVDISYSTKELFGQNSFPVAVARGTAKVQGKAKAAQLNGRMINDLFFAQTLSAGQKGVANDEAATIPATPFQVTVTNAATFTNPNGDYGVRDATTGLALQKVSSAPATGQYSVNEATGVYTFAAADTGKAVLISYTYGITGTGNKIVIANQIIGVAPTFRALLNILFAGKPATFELNACVATKLAMATKLEDFMIPEFDFSAFVDAAGNLGTFSLAE
jgi:hypothetical protein